MLREDDLAGATNRLLAALDTAVHEIGDTSWMGHPVMASAKRLELHRTLRRYLTFEVDRNEKQFNNRSPAVAILRTAVLEHELRFEEVLLVRNGVTLRFRGSIDRVEVGVDDRVDSAHFVAAVDYKTSKYAAPGAGKPRAWEEGVVLQAPLYAHALQVLRPGAVVSRFEYRAIKQCDLVHPLELHEVERRTRRLIQRDDGVLKMEASLDAAASHVQRVRAGEFPANPAASCGCPDYCHARDVCRVAGGPRKAK